MRRFVNILIALAVILSIVPAIEASAQSATVTVTVCAYNDRDNDGKRGNHEELLSMATISVSSAASLDDARPYDRRYSGGDGCASMNVRTGDGSTRAAVRYPGCSMGYGFIEAKHYGGTILVGVEKFIIGRQSGVPDGVPCDILDLDVAGPHTKVCAYHDVDGDGKFFEYGDAWVSDVTVRVYTDNHNSFTLFDSTPLDKEGCALVLTPLSPYIVAFSSKKWSIPQQDNNTGAYRVLLVPAMKIAGKG